MNNPYERTYPVYKKSRSEQVWEILIDKIGFNPVSYAKVLNECCPNGYTLELCILPEVDELELQVTDSTNGKIFKFGIKVRRFKYYRSLKRFMR